MATNTVRSVVIFSVIAVGFIGLTAGSVFLLKSRNHSLATTQSKQTAQKQSQSSDSSKKEVAKTDDSKKTSSDSSASSTANKDASKQSTTPAASTPSNTTTDGKGSGAVTPTSVPATGPSLPGMVATTVLMMAAAFFGGQLMRARTAYRRHLEG